MLDDRTAVEQARRGDERAWRELYERHVDLVFRLAIRVVNDRDVAMDVVQEAFVKASRSISGFRGDSSFKSWIASIALNEARSWHRKRSRERQVSLDSVPEPEAMERGAEEVMSDVELAGRAMDFIRTLPAQQRDAVMLRTTEGLSYREIAAIVGSSEGSVRVSYHHGMTKLREHMKTVLSSGTGDSIRT
ncbi:MAG: RNA polymerase sigma factor [Gemmatimonadota bacterium]|nr:RNA polymerase sigma factor [Gemmatimonadota bacterium]